MCALIERVAVRLVEEAELVWGKLELVGLFGGGVNESIPRAA